VVAEFGGRLAGYIDTENLDLKTDEWLNEIARVNRHVMVLNSAASALLVVDMQRYFLDESCAGFTAGGPAIVPNIARLVAAFRASDRPVIFTRHVHNPDESDLGIMAWWWRGRCVEGTPESEIIGELAPLEGENVIPKHRYSAFYNTDLDIVLGGGKIEDLVITGVMTNLCCESTARDAYFRDYRVFFPADATGSVGENMHRASLLNLAFGFTFVTKTERIISELVGPHPEVEF